MLEGPLPSRYSHMDQLTGSDQAIIAHQRLPRGQNALLTVCGQGDVSRAGMAAVKRPFGLAMTDDEDSGTRHAGVDTTG